MWKEPFVTYCETFSDANEEICQYTVSSDRKLNQLLSEYQTRMLITTPIILCLSVDWVYWNCNICPWIPDAWKKRSKNWLKIQQKMYGMNFIAWNLKINYFSLVNVSLIAWILTDISIHRKRFSEAKICWVLHLLTSRTLNSRPKELRRTSIRVAV